MAYIDISRLNFAAFDGRKFKKTDFTKEQLAQSNIENDLQDTEPVGSLEILGYDTTSKVLRYVLVIVGILGAVALAMLYSNLTGQPIEVATIPIFILLTATTLFGYVMLRSRARQRHLRLLRFALDNGLMYTIAKTITQNDGVVFHIGNYSRVLDTIIFSNELYVSAYYYMIGMGSKSKTEVYVDYARLQLPAEFPNMYLKGQNSRIGTDIQHYYAQRLSLEGGFDQQFALYAPTGRQVDVLQVFTPDVMAAIVDAGADYDYELQGGALYVYAQPGTIYSRDKLWKFLGVVERVANEINKQVKGYSASVDIVSNGASQALSTQDERFKRKILTPGLMLVVAAMVIVGFVLSLGMLSSNNISGGVVTLLFTLIITATIIMGRYISRR